MSQLSFAEDFDRRRLLLIGGDATVLATIDGASWQEIGSLPDARGLTAAVQFTWP